VLTTQVVQAGGGPVTPVPVVTYTVTTVTAYPGRYTNDANVGLGSPDFDAPVVAGNQATLTARDYGASITLQLRSSFDSPTDGTPVVLTQTLTLPQDSDQDGLPDAWETQYFGNSTSGSGTADTDGDGMINTDEFVAGTDPTDALSVLKVVLNATNSALLHFVAQTNRGYTVQYQTNLQGTIWRSLTNVGISSQVRTMQLNAPNPPPESERFYRIVTPPLVEP
jgi:hypothetical protein